MVNTYEEAVAQIKERLDIYDVVSKYVALKKAGSNYIGLCPFHQDKNPSMSVSPSKGIFKCFSCGASGDALSFIIQIEKKDFKEVIQELAEKFGIELPKTFSGGNVQYKSIKADMIKACEKAVQFYTKNFPAYRQSLPGLLPDDMSKYKMNYLFPFHLLPVPVYHLHHSLYSNTAYVLIVFPKPLYHPIHNPPVAHP